MKELGRLEFVPPGTRTAGIQAFDGPLGLRNDAGRDGVLYVPETAERGAPVILFFHGATGTGRRELRAIVSAADEHGAVVVAPDSRQEGSWDIIALRTFGPDVDFADRALNAVADRCDVDFSRLAIGGISDGASYALSLGIANGDLFPTIVAYSPGFLVPPVVSGKPRVFISHGTRDTILPIDMCGRAIAHGLGAEGYPVLFAEFDGGHTVPPPIAEAGFNYWLRPESEAEHSEPTH